MKDTSHPMPILYVEVQYMYMIWCLSGIDNMPTPLSGIGKMPTPNVRSDVCDRVESYTMHMILACRQKITFTSNLKLIISFLVLLILVISFIKSL
jgi:hypothetical protein